ncbi:hypothetical protein ACVBEH_29610, partial [Roseateles sp. GG27B]
ASRSYGVQVARLAGMPASLVRQARATLEALEAKASAGDAQIDLFAAPPVLEALTPATVHPATSPLTLAMNDVNPDNLSPREALEL